MSAFRLGRISKERHIVGRRGICVDVLESHIHGPNVNSQVFELGEQIVEVVGCECKLCWLDILRGKGEIWACECVREGDGRGGSCCLLRLGLAILITLSLQLQSVCEVSFVGSYKVGEIL